MSTWKQHSNLHYVAIYIGGVNRACKTQSHLDKDWVDRIDDLGWGIVPVWVGPQAPCAGFSHHFSSDYNDAKRQGRFQANSAIDKGQNLGIRSGTILWADIEAPTTQCKSAVRGFLAGWGEVMHERNRKSGAYGSACGSNVDNWWNINASNRPDQVWAANYNNAPSVYALGGCVNDSHWHAARMHQYKGNVNRTYGGVTMNVDVNCARGGVDGNHSSYGDQSDCYS